MTKAPYFHLAFRPNIALVSTVRRFIAEFYRRVLVDQELSPRLALATHELLENAVAYALDEETEVRIEIVEQQLTVKTWNRTLPERLANLKIAIDEMNAEPDADLYYQKMLVRTSKRTDGSGLGLARIRAESEMSLGYEIDHNRVCIMATCTVTGGIQPMTVELPKRTNDVLKVDASYADGVLAARFVGTADLESKADLEAVVVHLRQEALARKTSSVVIDFRELEFMNSSSFKVFVAWLASVQELPPEQQYKITLRSNPNLHWQRRSLAALSCFAADLVAIET